MISELSWSSVAATDVCPGCKYVALWCLAQSTEAVSLQPCCNRDNGLRRCRALLTHAIETAPNKHLENAKVNVCNDLFTEYHGAHISMIK